MDEQKTKGRKKPIFTDDYIANISAEVYKARPGTDEVQRVMAKAKEAGKDGEVIILSRGQFYLPTVRATLEILHARGLLEGNVP